MSPEQSRDTCLFCATTGAAFTTGGEWIEVCCPVCGTYRLTDSARTALQNGEYSSYRWRFAIASRRASDSGAPLRLKTDDLERVHRDPTVVAMPLDVSDALLARVARHAPSYGASVVIPSTDWAKYGFSDDEAFRGAMRLMRDMGLVSIAQGSGTAFPLSLSPSGWQRATKLLRERGAGPNAFVAMSFDPTLASAFDDGILRSIETDCGFTAIRVDREQYNDKIDDRIIADLRRARFVVADFTMHRPGVYFEAGFGLGLGLEVIYTCRSDEIDKAHFDTRQYNHITWENPADLRTKLTNRIRATIGDK